MQNETNKAVEVVTPVLTPVTVMLSEAQVKALAKLDLTGETADIAAKAIASAIKGKFSYRAEKAKEECGKAYDMVSRMGVKLDHDRATYVKKYTLEINDILAGL